MWNFNMNILCKQNILMKRIVMLGNKIYDIFISLHINTVLLFVYTLLYFGASENVVSLVILILFKFYH